MTRWIAAAFVVALLVPSPARAQVAFFPTTAPAFSGVQLDVAPVVSKDRRYVRVGVNANFQELNGFQTFPVPAVAGGVGGGGGLGGLGGLGGGGGGRSGGAAAGGPSAGLRSVGGIGFAGMNGPVSAVNPSLWNDRPLASLDSGFYDPGLMEMDARQEVKGPTKLQLMKARRRKGVIAKPVSP